MIDSTDELIEKMVEQNKKNKQILSQLEKVPQPYRIILEEVYIWGKSLVEAANDIGYNYEYIKRMHGIALNKFEEVTKSY